MVAQLPTGTVTFLFTDIEGSTPLWEQMPEAMQVAEAQHHAILRQAIERHGGQVFQVIGDAFASAFRLAPQALRAAVDAQQALSAAAWGLTGPIRVRMGLHTGPAELDGNNGANYALGHTLNRVARVMSAGHGGQILLSQEAADLVRRDLPGEVSLRDMGEHRLKGLSILEHLYQAVAPNLRADFPSLKSLSALPNNLPVQLTSFVGRQKEIAEAVHLLSTARLVTFTGSGGTGKTRLALQIAGEVLPSFEDGVWLVELASLVEADQVLQALASVLELRTLPGGIPLLNLVTDYLRNKRLLIILDNCEHLIDASVQLANHLLHACPQIKILASSRESLGLPGEVAYRVPSLCLPDKKQFNLEEINQSEAVQLFVERASTINPVFALTESNVTAVAHICLRLDGIPLALELAAARVKLFPPDQIAARLEDRFRLLTGGSRTALPRQQTLRALIDWSYDLLSEPERLLLRQLSVFVGGWTFEAAEAVCADLDVLNLLEQLVNKSLVIVEENQMQARYHMLETIRQYAREKLFEAGEGAALRDRHLDYFLQLSKTAEPELRGGNVFKWFDLLDEDLDNIRAAVEWGQEHRIEDALLLIGNLFFYLGFRVEDRALFFNRLEDLLLKLQNLPADGAISRRRLHALARGTTSLGLLKMVMGYIPETIRAFDDAIVLEREQGDSFYLGIALGNRAALEMMVGDLAIAKAMAEESLEAMGDMDGKRWLLVAETILLQVEYRLGNLERSQEIRSKIHQQLGMADHPLFLPTFLGLGLEARFQGRLEDAKMYFSEGLKIARRLKTRNFGTVMESELAHIARQVGELQPAKAAYRKLILTWKDHGQIPAVANMLECIAFIARAESQLLRAVRLLGAAQSVRKQINAEMRNYEQEELNREVAALRLSLSPDEFAQAWAQGSAMTLEQAVQFALSEGGENG